MLIMKKIVLIHELGCKKPALIVNRFPERNDAISHKDFSHLDGRQIEGSEIRRCDSCGKVLTGLDFSRRFIKVMDNIELNEDG